MKKELFVILGVLMLLVGFVSADVADLSIEEVQVNGVTLNPNDLTKLSVERGEHLNLRVTLASIADTENVILRAFIDGYEHSDYEDISDKTDIFDVKANVRYVKRLSLKLPEDLDKDVYTIKILVSDRYGEIKEYYYNIQVDSPRHAVTIKDVVLNPENYIKAGSYLTAFVRVKNIGEKTEDSVKVTVSVPQLGISSSDFIDEIDPEDAVSTEEIALKIPECTKEGEYELVIKAEYNDGYDEITTQKYIKVLESEYCPEFQEAEAGKLLVTIPTTVANVEEGGKAEFLITIANTGKDAKDLMLYTDNVDWANVELSENAVVINGEDVKIIKLYVTPKEDETGAKSLNLNIKSGDKVIKSVPFTVNVEEKGGVAFDVSKIKIALEIGIVILVIILVVVVLLVALRKGPKSTEKNEEGSYY